MATESIKLSEDMAADVEKASEALGIKKNELVGRAVLLYLDNLHKYMDLKMEFKEWEKLSDEALSNFEKSL